MLLTLRVLPCVLLCAACAAPTGSLESDPRDLEVLDYLERCTASFDEPGGVLAVARGSGGPLFARFGVPHDRAKRPWQVWAEAGDSRDLEDVLPGGPPERWIVGIGSFVEPMLALVVLRFEEQGRLKLSDPIAKFLPEFAAPLVHLDRRPAGEDLPTRPASEPITVEHLLTHRSGIPLLPWPYSSAFTHGHVAPVSLRPILEAFARRSAEEGLRQYVARIATLPLRSEPGEERFVGESFSVLGALLEETAGKPLARILAEELFDPLGMTDTGFHVSGEKRDRLMPFLFYFPTAAVPPVCVDLYTSHLFPTADPIALSVRDGCSSTGADLLRFAECLAGRGERAGVRIVSTASFERGFERGLLGDPWPVAEGAEPGSAPRGILFDPSWLLGGDGSCLLARFDEPFAAAVLWFLRPTGNCRGYQNPWLGVPLPPWPSWAR